MNKVRCAIYTRKSTEEGLEKEFNTLEAQREACESFVKSRVYEGWETIPVYYDDGGFSGGNMQRPALKRLISDIELGKVDMIVVYKIDRLTRNLTDFSKLIEVLDKHKCSFVSVTQQFNTADSTGRLMLNVLLSFAQFEREISSERIRDKVAASKKKGMWMGGTVPLGYDLIDKKLIINKEEGQIVKFIFKNYLEYRSEKKVVELSRTNGFCMKIRINKKGIEKGGRLLNLASLSSLLRNPIYMGKIPHKDKLFDGLHESLISHEDWQAVQTIKASNIRNRFGDASKTKKNALKGLVECDCCGYAMVVTSTKKGNKYYDYYTSLKAIKEGYAKCKLGSIPAGELESFVITKIQNLFKSPQIVTQLSKKVNEVYPEYGERDIWDFMQSIDKVFKHFSPATINSIISQVVNKIIVAENTIVIRYNPFAISIISDNDKTKEKGYNANYLEFRYPIKKLKAKGRSGTQIIPMDEATKPERALDFKLLNGVIQAFQWAEEIKQRKMTIKEFAHFKHLDRSRMSRILRICNLAPDIIESIIKGTQSRTMKIDDLIRNSIPHLWKDQRELYGFNL